MNRPTAENIAIWTVVIVGFFLVVMMDWAGLPQKWHAAIVGTAISFGGVVAAYQRKWRYRRFWISLGICFVVHILLMWIVFQRILAPVRTLGILIWSPIAFAEIILLVAVIPVIERKLRRKDK